MVFDINSSTGALMLRATVPNFEGGPLAFSPNGKYLLASNATKIFLFPLDANGLPGQPSSLEISLLFFSDAVIDVTNRYIYLTSNNGLAAVRIGDDHSLSSVQGSPYSMVQESTRIAIDGSGRFVYANAKSGAELWAFTVNQTTGALALVPGSPYTFNGLTAATGLAVDGAGRYLFVGDAAFTPNPWRVFSYKIDQTTGALSLVPGSPAPVNGDTFFGWTEAVP